MRDFVIFDSQAFYGSSTVMELSFEQRALYKFLILCPQRTVSGIYRISLDDILFGLGTPSEGQANHTRMVSEWLSNLNERNLIQLQELPIGTIWWIWVIKAFEHERINKNTTKSMMDRLITVLNNDYAVPLIKGFLGEYGGELEGVDPDRYEELQLGVRERFANGKRMVGEPSTQTETRDKRLETTPSLQSGACEDSNSSNDSSGGNHSEEISDEDKGEGSGERETEGGGSRKRSYDYEERHVVCARRLWQGIRVQWPDSRWVPDFDEMDDTAEKWANEMRRLEDHGSQKGRSNRALKPQSIDSIWEHVDFYAALCEQEAIYTVDFSPPHCQTAATFREKFDKVVDAKRRANAEYRSKGSDDTIEKLKRRAQSHEAEEEPPPEANGEEPLQGQLPT